MPTPHVAALVPRTGSTLIRVYEPKPEQPRLRWTHPPPRAVTGIGPAPSEPTLDGCWGHRRAWPAQLRSPGMSSTETPTQWGPSRISTVPFPIPYQGSKRKLAPAILRCFPTDVTMLHEPFCGSAAVTIAALSTGRARAASVNDANDHLMGLWAAIVNEPLVLAERYSDLWHEQLGREREFYDEVRDTFNRAHEAHHFLFLLARCVKAAVRYNSDGEFNQSPDNRRRGTRPRRMADHIVRTELILRDRVTTSANDYLDALNAVTADDLVYMDPPYQGVSTNRDRRYKEGLTYDGFVSTLEDLNRQGISYIISYDGRTGTKRYGEPLPASLQLGHFEVDAGRSTQATLLGRDHRTVESLYLSPALLERLGGAPRHLGTTFEEPPNMFDCVEAEAS